MRRRRETKLEKERLARIRQLEETIEELTGVVGFRFIEITSIDMGPKGGSIIKTAERLGHVVIAKAEYTGMVRFYARKETR